jgi:hypothetical protein
MTFTDWCYLRAMDIEAMNLSPADAKAFLALARSAFECGAKHAPAHQPKDASSRRAP